MRKVLLLALLAGLLGRCCWRRRRSPSQVIEVDDNYFVHEGAPNTVTVHKGRQGRVGVGGHATHNVTVTKGPVKFHSKTKNSGSFEKTLKKAGTYKIVCTIHAPDMRMTLKVVK